MKYVQNIKQMNAVINNGLAHANAPHSIGFPQEITITTTLRCNYRCIMCYQAEYTGEMDEALLGKLDPLLPFAKTFQIFGGEPMLYSNIQQLYGMAHRSQAMATMISNGSLLTDAMCDDIVKHQVGHIKFSIDAGTPETYKKIRGGNFYKVLKGIGQISLNKARLNTPFPDMQFNFLAMRSNVAELPKLITLAKEVGVSRINVFYPGIYKKELVEECVWFHQEYSDKWLSMARTLARELGVGLTLPPLFSECDGQEGPGKRAFCADPWTKLLVAIDGEATLCCGGPTRIGNLLTDDFEAIWNGEVAQKLRATVNTPDEPSYCKICRVRKPNPLEIKLHISSKELQEYGMKKFGMTPPAAPAEAVQGTPPSERCAPCSNA